MSSSAKGAQRVGSAMTQLAKLGFRCSRVSASGQRKGARRAEKCIAGDLIALAPDGSLYPHVIAEIGGVSKRVRAAFAELRAEPLAAGFVPIVGRVVRRRWRWYSEGFVPIVGRVVKRRWRRYSAPQSRHKTLKEALEASVPFAIYTNGRDLFAEPKVVTKESKTCRRSTK